MDRTIRKDGILFRCAYWFTNAGHRPESVNRCPFFWRLVFVILVGMPLWWLVWAPFSLVVGFFFAARPRLFRSDDCRFFYEGWDEYTPWVPYHHWPRIYGVHFWPAIVPAAYIVLIIAQIAANTTWFYGHSALFWVVVAAAVTIATLFAIAAV